MNIYRKSFGLYKATVSTHLVIKKRHYVFYILSISYPAAKSELENVNAS